MNRPVGILTSPKLGTWIVAYTEEDIFRIVVKVKVGVLMGRMRGR